MPKRHKRDQGPCVKSPNIRERRFHSCQNFPCSHPSHSETFIYHFLWFLFFLSSVISSYLFHVTRVSQTQPIQAQAVVAAHPPHHTQFKKLLLPRRRAAAYIPLLRADGVAKPLAAGIAAAPASAPAGDRDADGVVAVVGRGVQRHAMAVVVVVGGGDGARGRARRCG